MQPAAHWFICVNRNQYRRIFITPASNEQATGDGVLQFLTALKYVGHLADTNSVFTLQTERGEEG